jgi:glycosyltransferase involved in cell wall biosynthesis
MTSLPTIEPSNIAMLASGKEKYGIGTILKIYALGWPEMTTICIGRGPYLDWLRENDMNVIFVEGERKYRAGGYLDVLLSLPAEFLSAKKIASKVQSLICHSDIQVIHAHRLPHYLIAGHLKRSFRYKSVWQINNNTNRRRLFDAGSRLNAKIANWGADILLPASNYVSANWERSTVPRRTIHNAAKPEKTEMNESLPRPPLRCLVAGRLEESKGHHVAIDAVLEVRRSGREVCLDIFGGPLDHNPYVEKLKEKIRTESAAEYIQFRGFKDELRKIQAKYHLGLQCRIDPEPCSLWVCEAQSDGLPLIASETGGTSEIVMNNKTCILVPPNSATALAQQISRLYDSSTEISKMRAAAREFGQSYLTTDRMLTATLDAYNDPSCSK